MAERPYAELSFGGTSVRLPGYGSDVATHVERGGIEGWWGTPDSKVSLTERGGGDGAHSVAAPDVLYAARAVTVHLVALGLERERVHRLRDLVARAAGNMCKLRVVDGGSDTFATGYVELRDDGTWSERHMALTLTLTCPDPRRYSWAERSWWLSPGSGTNIGGLWYGDSGSALSYPLWYGDAASKAHGFATLENLGTATAWPVVEVSGTFADGVRLDVWGPAGATTVLWDGYVGAVPLVLDFLSRTARIDSLDVSRSLSLRGFQGVPQGGSLKLALRGAGSGYARARLRDTYI